MSQAEVDAANKLIIDSITKYKVIVAGCRDFADCELLKEKCDFYLQNKKPENIVIVSGHASGADALGERYAQERGLHRPRTNRSSRTSSMFAKAILKISRKMSRSKRTLMMMGKNNILN